MGELGSFLPIILMFAVVYFFMIAPQMKRAKQEKKFAAELKRGDKVITKSGIHGKVMELNDKDDSCVIETLAGKIKMEKSSLIGEILAKRAKDKNIDKVYFDRGSYKYHGRVKIFAETLRKNGIKF